jgi:hypothetical protein
MHNIDYFADLTSIGAKEADITNCGKSFEIKIRGSYITTFDVPTSPRQVISAR